MSVPANPSMIVRVLPAQQLLDIQLFGLLSCDDVRALVAQAEQGVVRLGCEPGAHRSLYDISACKIQPQAVVNAMREAITNTNRAGRLAVVAGSSLMRMQLRRILAAEWDSRVFGERAEALIWLRQRDETRFSQRIAQMRQGAAPTA